MAVGDVLDEALEALSDVAPDFENGNTNHAPMVAETLVQIGREDAVIPWVDDYRRDLGKRPTAGRVLVGDWREALGDIKRWPEWVALFRRELAEAAWPAVADTWSGRLAPGLAGAATHGLIRTAHAVRSVETAATPLRLNELADGLAYWAATYHEFRVVPEQRAVYSLDDALSRVPQLNLARLGNIDQTLDQLDGSNEFELVGGSLQIGDDPLQDLSQLTECFAGLYLANAADAGAVFALVHAVTGPSALRLIAPHISAANARVLLRYAWQTAAAIYAIYIREYATPATPDRPSSNEVLLEAAVDSGAAHAIKFTEACLREYAMKPQPVFLAAASDAVKRLDG
jgi:Questin oxidase-like